MPLTSPDQLTPARVRKLLKSRGLSQAAAARGAGIGEAELSRIVARSMQPTPSQARRLLEVLDPAQSVVTTGTVQVSADA